MELTLTSTNSTIDRIDSNSVSCREYIKSSIPTETLLLSLKSLKKQLDKKRVPVSVVFESFSSFSSFFSLSSPSSSACYHIVKLLETPGFFQEGADEIILCSQLMAQIAFKTNVPLLEEAHELYRPMLTASLQWLKRSIPLLLNHTHIWHTWAWRIAHNLFDQLTMLMKDFFMCTWLVEIQAEHVLLNLLWSNETEFHTCCHLELLDMLNTLVLCRFENHDFLDGPLATLYVEQFDGSMQGLQQQLRLEKKADSKHEKESLSSSSSIQAAALTVSKKNRKAVRKQTIAWMDSLAELAESLTMNEDRLGSIPAKLISDHTLNQLMWLGEQARTSVFAHLSLLTTWGNLLSCKSALRQHQWIYQHMMPNQLHFHSPSTSSRLFSYIKKCVHLALHKHNQYVDRDLCRLLQLLLQRHLMSVETCIISPDIMTVLQRAISLNPESKLEKKDKSESSDLNEPKESNQSNESGQPKEYEKSETSEEFEEIEVPKEINQTNQTNLKASPKLRGPVVRLQHHALTTLWFLVMNGHSAILRQFVNSRLLERMLTSISTHVFYCGCDLWPTKTLDLLEKILDCDPCAKDCTPLQRQVILKGLQQIQNIHNYSNSIHMKFRIGKAKWLLEHHFYEHCLYDIEYKSVEKVE
ncbi:MAG: hypothetical protein Sylvanvirus8_6 [Sylvanvirus sp.]|uniref:Uncharacterized protein n=1 Tax=Sylvanvirus sp. TaxID=2487774 RepID=A0A3G5AHV0_9VIRU|nr:MAG: hypothetical protein Sylvanvirus8_6 [Sylvanvirus sp.]